MSGYNREQNRSIIKNGLPLRNTATGSSKNRFLKKLIGKTMWYKKKMKSTASSVGEGS